jgi:hypothetical protein
MRVLILLLSFLIASTNCPSQNLYQIDSKWQLRTNQNDPNLDHPDYKEIRISFRKSGQTTYLVFGCLKNEPQPHILRIQREMKFSDLSVTLNIQVLKDGAWSKYQIDFPVNKWGEASTRKKEDITKVYNDFLSAKRARLRLAIEGEHWTEFSMTSFLPIASKLFPPPQIMKDEGREEESVDKFKGMAMDFPDRGLFLGLRNNAYVKQLKIDLAISNADGNYDATLKDAVAFYIQANEVKNIKADGSLVTYELYLKILNVDENCNPLPEKNDKEKQSEEKSKINANKNQAYDKGDILFPLFFGQGDPKDGYNPATWGVFITSLQNAVRAKTTGVMDEQTFKQIKKFLNNPKIQKLVVEPLDSESRLILENESKPGVNVKLYNFIMRTNDLRILHNRNAERPEDMIEL